jgi:hypothetical protein
MLQAVENPFTPTARSSGNAVSRRLALVYLDVVPQIRYQGFS